MKLNNFIFFNLLVILVLLGSCSTRRVQKRGVMDNLNEGLKFAGQMFGVNTAADVANLVARAFSSTGQNKGKPDVFSLIQKGLQSLPSKTQSEAASSEDPRREKQKNYDSGESGRDHQQPQNDKSEETTTSSNKDNNVGLSAANLVTSMLRMVGFDATKLGALAINVLIMVASTIGTTLLGATKPQRRRNPHGEENEHFEDGPRHDYHHNAEYENADNGPEEQYSPTDHQPRSLKDGSPIDWFLQNPSTKMKSLLDQAIDAELPDKIIEMISRYESKVGQTTCLKMLMCKSSPIIWGMQNSLKKRINGEENSTKEQAEKSAENKRPFSTESFYTHMPSLDEFREHGAKCDKLYSNYCNTTELHRKKRY